jgi:hypothetical protein
MPPKLRFGGSEMHSISSTSKKSFEFFVVQKNAAHFSQPPQ